MVLKLINLDGKTDKYKYSLAEISEQEWKLFFKEVVDCTSKRENVTSIMASVTVRDNKAKVKLAYDDGKYHEVIFVLDENGISVHNYEDIISCIWQDIMTRKFGLQILAKGSSTNC